MDLVRVSSLLDQNAKLGVVPLAEVKAQLRVTHTAEDGLISNAIEAAYDHLAGENGWLGRCCLLNETFTAYMPAAGRLLGGNRDYGVEIPMRPFVSVTDFDWLQADASYLAVETDLYVTRAAAGDFACISRLGSGWPYAGTSPRGYRVTFVAGYGTTKESIPSPIRQAIKMLAAHLYAQRETVAEKVGGEVLYGLRALAGRYRVAPDHD